MFDPDIYHFSSDAGTLLYLGDGDKQTDYPRYIITSFTLGFASSELVEAVKNETPLTRK
jgi:hypothetical protein